MTAATTRRTTSNSRGGRVRGNSDARDAVLRAAEDARQDGIRSEQGEQQDDARRKMIDAGDLKHLVKEMPSEFLPCRSFGHGKALANYTNERGYRSFTLYCPSCQFRRDIVINNRTGEIVEDKPSWPEGYLLPKGSGRIGRNTKGIVRLETVNRLFEGTKSQVKKTTSSRKK